MQYLTSVLFFTTMLGQTSYVARNCYSSKLELKEYRDDYGQSAGDFPSTARLLHDNTAVVYLSLDTLGWTALSAYLEREWVELSFSLSRMIYLLSLQQTEGKVYTVSTS